LRANVGRIPDRRVAPKAIRRVSDRYSLGQSFSNLRSPERPKSRPFAPLFWLPNTGRLDLLERSSTSSRYLPLDPVENAIEPEAQALVGGTARYWLMYRRAKMRELHLPTAKCSSHWCG
jgi:hypothetical protein